MTILYSREVLMRVLRERKVENQKYQHALTSSENVRVFAYRQMFCELFAGDAPGAWSSLLQMQDEAGMWLRSQFIASNKDSSGNEATWQKVAADESIAGTEPVGRAKLLELRIEAWALQQGIDVPWIKSSALKTLQAISCLAVFDAYAPSEGSRAPPTLLFDDFPVLVIDGVDIELGYARQQSQFHSLISVDGHLEMLTWDSLTETRSQFWKQATEKLDAHIGQQLEKEIALAGVVAGRRDLEVHAHHMQWTIQRYAEKRAIRSLHLQHGSSRPAISKAINQVASVLDFQELPEKWGAASAKQRRSHAT
jgi:hypothetical protein